MGLFVQTSKSPWKNRVAECKTYIFHHNFPKTLSTKVHRIKNEKMAKKDKLKLEEKEKKNDIE